MGSAPYLPLKQWRQVWGQTDPTAVQSCFCPLKARWPGSSSYGYLSLDFLNSKTWVTVATSWVHCEQEVSNNLWKHWAGDSFLMFNIFIHRQQSLPVWPQPAGRSGGMGYLCRLEQERYYQPSPPSLTLLICWVRWLTLPFSHFCNCEGTLGWWGWWGRRAEKSKMATVLNSLQP